MNKPDRTPEEIQKDALRFEALRRAAETTLQCDVEDEALAPLLGVGSRSIRRYANGSKVPSESMIRHFWTCVFREAIEAQDGTMQIDAFFRGVDANVETWILTREVTS